VAKVIRLFDNRNFESMLKANLILSKSSIKKEYNSDMVSEYQSLKEALPETTENILDIGSGIAGLDVQISSHYNNEIQIFLLDKSTIDEDLHYGFEKIGSFYNSLLLSKKVLVDNGILESNVFLQEATVDNKITFNKKFDLIISIISWGFHYPVETYLDEVFDNLKLGGTLILDVRKDSNGLELLKIKFGNHMILGDFKKHYRLKIVKDIM
jgi:hypothetical protein